MIQRGFAYWGMTISFYLLIIVLLYVGIGNAWRHEPIVMYQPLKVITDPVHAGGTLGYEVHSIKKVSNVCKVTRQIMNGHSIVLETVTSNLPKGQIDKIMVVNIPSFVPSGDYVLRVTYTYNIGLPLLETKKVSLAFDSQKFRVIGRDEAPL